MTRRIALLLVVVTLCMGCGGRIGMRQLQELEAQLDSVPHLVQQSLDSIPFATLRGEARALYAILKTQADYKCYVPLTTDTLIRYATNYYNRNRKSYRAAMAWYSLGCVYTELQDDAAAIGAYLRAKTLFPDTTVRYHAVCNHNLGRHYLNREMYDDALCSLRSCKQQSVMLSDSSTVGYCDYYIGCAYLYQKLYDSAEVYFDQVECNTQAANACITILSLQRAKIAFHRDCDYTKAQKMLSRGLTSANSHISMASFSYLADIFEQRQLFDSTYIVSKHILSHSGELHTRCWNYKRLAELSPLLGETDSTAYYISQYTFLLDSIYRLRQQEEINDIRNDLTLSHYRQQQIRERVFHNIVGVFVFVTTVLCVWLGFNKRENRLLKKSQQLNDELYQIRTDLLYGTAKGDGCTESSLSPDEIHAYYSRLYDACLQRYRQTASYTSIQPSQLHIDKQQRENVIADLKHCFADLISAVHSATPTLSADILLTCLCLSLGYSTDTITNLFVISPQTVRSRKSRAKKELSEPLFSLLCNTWAK